ncbi:MAG: hypothetical protein M4579_000672 [Chaenotheca gracillima]|nr:MAG: hypothetical protein M4579_000672 [Chaenotheca gracillima]
MPTIEVGPDAKRHLQDIADILAKSKKVVVVTGAGISTNSGIPDFRSENGLYSLIQSHYDAAAAARSSTESDTSYESLEMSSSPPISSQDSNNSVSSTKLPSNIKGKDLFDSLVWSNPLSTSIFYTFIASLRKKIREEVRQTTPTHRFIRVLRDGGKLVRCYTQNIDGLEERDGLCTELRRGKGNRSRFTQKVLAKPRPDGPILPGSASDGGCEVVQLHGDLADLRCGLCNQLSGWDEEDREATLLAGEAPECNLCVEKSEDRLNRGKRGIAVGNLRPNVVLYGEEHPSSNLLSPITTHDLGLNPDTLLILGTSLRVHGLKVLVKEFAKSVHARGGGKGKVIFVNKTKPPESVWSDVIDFWVSMDCDDWVHGLREHRADIWERQGTLKLPVIKGPSRSKIAKPKSESTTSVMKDKEQIKVPKRPTKKSNPSKESPTKTSAPKKLVIPKTASKASRPKPRPKAKAPPKKRQALSAIPISSAKSQICRR